ncbi:MAG: hypothetical protein H0X66_08545 [Verrucomicrobia bacterium]|nr:hypothetical protein [Verrucomicrobiota bacterium]
MTNIGRADLFWLDHWRVVHQTDDWKSASSLPPKAQADGAHLAIAAAAEANYLLTWNCRHLANAQILTRLEAEAQRLDWKLPKVCTPLELMGDLPYQT